MPILALSLVAASAASYSRRVPRVARLQLPDGYFHALNRGTRKTTIFLDEHDYEYFRRLLERVASRHGWVCHSYCLMPNHYHLAVEAETAQLASGMQRLNGIYAQRFNERYDESGHLFHGRFHSWVVEGDEYFENLVPYITQNPVRAGLCPRAEDWRWSSCTTPLRRVA